MLSLSSAATTTYAARFLSLLHCRSTELFLCGFESGASNTEQALHSNAVPMIELVPALSLVEAGVEVSRHDGSGVALLAGNDVKKVAFLFGCGWLD